jgi:hypothetical protein
MAVQTRMNASERRRAWRQGLLSILAFSAITVIFAAIRAQPDGADEMKIPLAALRSRAGELVLWQQAQPGLTVFDSAYRKQQLASIESTRDDIQKLRPANPGLEMLQSQLRDYSAVLVDAASSIADGSTDSSAAHAAAVAVQGRLRSAEENLHR